MILLQRWKVVESERLVDFLQKAVGGSGKKIRRSLDCNACKINGKFERFGSVRLCRGDVVEFFAPCQEKAEISILYENSSLMIVNKPAGWVCTDDNARKTFGQNLILVHRLDKCTSGALLLAKSAEVKNSFVDLFANLLIEKEYLALVDGCVRGQKGVMDTTLVKKSSFQGQTVWGSGAGGCRAITEWEVVSRSEKASLVQCTPITGRTHQIRVHMAEMGHPILVDRQYAKTFRCPIFASRPLLHAKRLAFEFEGEKVEVLAPLPQDFNDLLDFGVHPL